MNIGWIIQPGGCMMRSGGERSRRPLSAHNAGPSPGIGATGLGFVYRPVFYPQLNPADPLGGYSCTAYSAAYALDRATIGGVVAPGWLVREHTGLTPAQIIAGSGLTIPNVAKSLATWNVALYNRHGEPFAALLAALRAFKGVIAQGLNDHLADHACSGFAGPHCVYLNSLDAAGTQILLYNPLCHAASWVPVAIVANYLASLAGGPFWATTRTTPLIA